MSKQSDAKLEQGWNKTTVKICSNCTYFTHEQILMKTPWSSYTKDTNMRCTLGGFKTGKTSACNEWRTNPPNEKS
jgi:hypothetical protein